eukprot:12775870-Ditylum_brightwellii.AAC.1
MSQPIKTEVFESIMPSKKFLLRVGEVRVTIIKDVPCIQRIQISNSGEQMSKSLLWSSRGDKH